MVFANHYCISSNDITDMSGLFPLIGDIFHWATDHALYLNVTALVCGLYVTVAERYYGIFKITMLS